MQLSKLQRLACLAITGAIKMAQTAAMEILLGLPPLHGGIYRLMCSQQWKPKSTNLGHAKKCIDREQEPTLQIGTDRMTPKYAYQAKFPDNSE
jgi:hypothetical protein